MVFVVIVEQPFDDALIAMEREAQITDASSLALVLHVVDHAVFDVTFLEGVPAAQAFTAVAYRMQQIIVEIVGLQLFK